MGQDLREAVRDVRDFRDVSSDATNSTPYTLSPTPITLHPAPYTLHPTPYTQHLKPFTLTDVGLGFCGRAHAKPCETCAISGTCPRTRQTPAVWARGCRGGVLGRSAAWQARHPEAPRFVHPEPPHFLLLNAHLAPLRSCGAPSREASQLREGGALEPFVELEPFWGPRVTTPARTGLRTVPGLGCFGVRV